MVKRICTECATEFTARNPRAEFCCTGCKRTFNNRRALRGAVLYDLTQIVRLDGAADQRYKLGQRIEALKAQWDKEDAARPALRTWKRPLEVHFDTAHLTRV